MNESELTSQNPDLPLLSQDTVRVLRQDIGLTESRAGENNESPYTSVRKLVPRVFYDLAAENMLLVERFSSDLGETYGNDVGANDAYVAGMALTLRALELEEPQVLIAMGRLTHDDVQAMRNEIVNGAKAVSTTNVLKSVLNAPRMPETHYSLQDIVKNAGVTYGANNLHTELGAAAMFKAMQKAWPKIVSNPHSAPAPNAVVA